LYATHFTELTAAVEKRGGFARTVNYKVDSPTQEQGALRYPFTIHKGVSEYNCALVMAQESGVFDFADNMLGARRPKLRGG
jgi:DNA mismatch repair ATPase MutS